jgi:cytochrome c oxidase assembly protein subunit 11
MSKKSIIYFIIGLISLIFSLSYLAVPIYKLFCSQTGYGGTVQINKNIRPEIIQINSEKIIINFTSQIDPFLPLYFKENQKELTIIPGESTLAFYTSKNLSNKTLYGISTYNITPAKAGIYFHKIECFCFDEQRWKPHESIEMPILFYIDPLILTDPATKDINSISISYTFFNSDRT